MVSFSTALVVLFTLLSVLAKCDPVKVHAKKLITGKVLAKGHSVLAKSLTQCIEYCNARQDKCDGVVFHEIIGKCRIIDKCAPAFQVDNSTSTVYYSRRPQIKSWGYVHDPITDTCLGLVMSRVDYSGADAICAKQDAHLALIDGRHLNDLGRSLVANSTSDWAWIKRENVAHEEPKKPHGTSGNDVLSVEVFSPEVVQWRNSSTRSCWGLNRFGQWGQFSCKNSTMVVLCQVFRFNV